MAFAFWPAVLAGFVGTLVMTALIVVMRAAGKTRMDMVLLLGSMFTGRKPLARAIGLVMHLGVMGAVVFGSIYAFLFAVLGTAPAAAWWVGAIIGILHGLVVGLLMPMVPMVHPRMEGHANGNGGSADGVELAPPGLFARNYGGMTPVGLVMAHMLFGLVVGLVYAFLVH